MTVVTGNVVGGQELIKRGVRVVSVVYRALNWNNENTLHVQNLRPK